MMAFVANGCSGQDFKTDNNIDTNQKEMETEPTDTNQKEEEINPTDGSENESKKVIDFGKEFYPPHFQIGAFAVNTKKEENIEFKISYELDEELFEFLSKNNPTYYFSIEYPQFLVELINSNGSKLVKGQTIKKAASKREFNITINQSLSSQLSEAEIDQVITQLEGYKLIISNVNKYPIHIIDDIYYYTGYDPNLSQTEVK